MTTSEVRSVYLAGPDGFTPAGLAWHTEVLVPAVRAAGLMPLSPWAGATDPFETLRTMPPGQTRIDGYRARNRELARANAALIEQASAVLAMLDGPDIDSGTAGEIGYGSHAGLVVVGVRSDVRCCGDNEGAIVNLQVEYFIERSGGAVFADHHEALAHLAQVLPG